MKVREIPTHSISPRYVVISTVEACLLPEAADTYETGALIRSMRGTGLVKVPDGKLVQVAVTYEETIQSVRITGDFFLEPPGALADLEAAIEDRPVDVSKRKLIESIEEVDAKLIGFDATDLAAATREAIR